MTHEKVLIPHKKVLVRHESTILAKRLRIFLGPYAGWDGNFEVKSEKKKLHFFLFFFEKSAPESS